MPDTVWVVAGYFGLAVLSAVVPWFNAEVVMLSAVPLAASPLQLGLLVGAVTAGQMTGKATMYWIARRSHPARLQPFLDRWGARLESRPATALGVTFISSTVGFPPFYLVSMAAGALRVTFGGFLAVGTAGRLLHFGLVACLPHLYWRE